ncbi:MAG: glycosyltransferase family 39 protein [Anaerolineae bacterium]|nr:glycosyltransferase family 39 protein [Anaerolineae bacterium]
MQDADGRRQGAGSRQEPTSGAPFRRSWAVDGLLLGLALALFLALAGYQLGLPGLHYDEAKEAGNNALQLLRGWPVQAFRDAGLRWGNRLLPLMVQDYIGALNVYLAMPFLALFGVSVPALRLLPLLTAAATLLLLYALANEAFGRRAAAIATLLLAVNPSFVFWSRQGIFVTNITATLAVAAALTACRWWRYGRWRDLYLTAFLWGLGIYAKLLFVWVIGASIVVGAFAWWVRRISAAAKAGADPASSPNPYPLTLILFRLLFTVICFLLPLTPLILFNLQTGGTLASIFGSLDSSYYGVRNAAFAANLGQRLGQLPALLRGDHLWYLGGCFANPAAPWLALALALACVPVCAVRPSRHPRPSPLHTSLPLGGTVHTSLPLGGTVHTSLPLGGTEGGPSFLAPRPSPLASCFLPLAFCLLVVVQSSFTVSDLFITHYAILLPFAFLAVGAMAAGLLRWGGHLALVPVLASVIWWGAGDLWATVQYHRALAASGGHAAHSDAIYDLAAYLDAHGQAAPVALDWGIAAPVYFLTSGRVQPVELFGYERLDAPDAGFAGRLQPFLEPAVVFLFHVPEEEVFRGRRQAFDRAVAEAGLVPRVEEVFYERSGRLLFVLTRVEPP